MSDHAASHATAPPRAEPRSGNRLAVAAVAVGIVGTAVLLAPGTAFAASVLGTGALVLGLLGWRGARLRGLAVAGAVLGLVAIVLGFAGVTITSDNPIKHDHPSQGS